MCSFKPLSPSPIAFSPPLSPFPTSPLILPFPFLPLSSLLPSFFHLLSPIFLLFPSIFSLPFFSSLQPSSHPFSPSPFPHSPHPILPSPLRHFAFPALTSLAPPFPSLFPLLFFPSPPIPSPSLLSIHQSIYPSVCPFPTSRPPMTPPPLRSYLAPPRALSRCRTEG